MNKINLNNTILLAEDDNSLQLLIKEILVNLGYEVVTASNGKEGLELYNKYKFSVVITDLEMPEMSGRELINKIQSLHEDTVIIVLTSFDDTNTVITIMKLGIFDYIIKPVTKNKVLLPLERAFDAVELKKTQRLLEMDKFKRMEDQVSWLKYNNTILKKDQHRFDKGFFDNLHNNLTMGAGMGAVLAMIKMLDSSAEKKEDSYIIDSDLFDIIIKNVQLAESAIEVFSKIKNIMNNKMILERVDIIKVFELLHDVIKDMEKLSSHKSQKIILNKSKEDFTGNDFILANPPYLIESIKELLTNAMKFSRPDSPIYVIVKATSFNLKITILNEPVNKTIGIPPEYENLIFDPFYRMSKSVNPEYGSLDYGLGLTIVEKILNHHNATICAGNVKDFSKLQNDPVEKVSVIVEFPLENRIQKLH